MLSGFKSLWKIPLVFISNKEKEDVWALGVSLYLLSTFALPFDAENKFNLAIISKITDPAISH